MRKSKAVPYREENKKKLREEFELELFAFNRSQKEFTQQDNFLVKDMGPVRERLDNEEHLDARISELKEQIEKDKEEM